MKVMCVTRVQVESGDQRKWTCDRGENDGFGSWERGGVVLLCVCVLCAVVEREVDACGLSDFQECCAVG